MTNDTNMNTQAARASRRTGRRRLGVATVALAGGLILAGPITSASAATVLGGVDMQRACNDQYGAWYGYVAKPMNRYDAFSWRCTKPWDATRQIDVNRACATQYGGGAYSGYRNRYDAYSWFCQR